MISLFKIGLKVGENLNSTTSATSDATSETNGDLFDLAKRKNSRCD